MFTIAAGIVLGFVGIVALVVVVRFFQTVPVFKGIAEGWRGFKEGMKGIADPPSDKRK
ncbi:hypothetical protein [Granulicella tundricola]|uniref:Uncharacterized protein n=1 Tax=Granulicella tundricola (strain ATCC BAA-1859 / DSM 23138 / MP5ACTX9) TaxID=1198114 RepID=E8X827_GRATM|nr:hypothetical protein [Granulicella tundricola]ADW71611.1 hypothetical protein AciX9_4682 [Granulicella tundricola MP5ACTX9]